LLSGVNGVLIGSSDTVGVTEAGEGVVEALGSSIGTQAENIKVNNKKGRVRLVFIKKIDED